MSAILPSALVRVYVSLCHFFNQDCLLLEKPLFPDADGFNDLPDLLEFDDLGYSYSLETKLLVDDFRKINSHLRTQLGEKPGKPKSIANSEAVKGQFEKQYQKAFSKKLFWNVDASHAANPVLQFRQRVFTRLQELNVTANPSTLIHTANRICAEMCDRFADEMMQRKKVELSSKEFQQTRLPTEYQLASVGKCQKRFTKKSHAAEASKGAEALLPERKEQFEELDMSYMNGQIDWIDSKIKLSKEDMGCIKQCASTIQDRNQKGCENWQLAVNGDWLPLYHVSHGKRTKNGPKATLVFYMMGNQPRLLALAEHASSKGSTCYRVVQAMPGADIKEKKEYELMNPYLFTVATEEAAEVNDGASSSGYGSGTDSSSGSNTNSDEEM